MDGAVTSPGGLLDAVGVAVVVAATDGRVTGWNAAAEQLFGWDADEVLGRDVLSLLPARAPSEHERDALRRIRTGESWSAEVPLRRKDGVVVTTRVTAKPVTGPDGEVVAVAGVFQDVTEQRWRDEQMALARARLELALGAGGIGTWSLDRASGRVTWDPRMETLHGLRPGTFSGRLEDGIATIHPQDRPAVAAGLECALSDGTGYGVEYRVPLRDGSVRWAHCRGVVTKDSAGTSTGMIGVSLDVTDRHELLEAEQAARQRLAFLANASAALAESLDYRTTLNRVAELATPTLADWCVIDLVEGGELRMVALAGAEQDKVRILRELRGRYPVASSYGPGRVVLTGEPERASPVSDEVLRAMAGDDAHLAALRALDVHSAVVVPLAHRDRPIGALTLAYSGSRRVHADEDLALAVELGRHAAAAIDNARLFRERSRVARVLQKSLLPPKLPAIPGVEVAASYQASGTHEIGGDFYDLFENADGSWTALLGDVCGKGVEAAVLTGLIRHTVHAVALRETSPVRTLELLNEALLDQDRSERFCTAVCVRLAWEGDEFVARVASAGNPTPWVLRSDGTVEPVETVGGLVGVLDEVGASVVRVALGEGDALLLHTDGITEARAGRNFFGTEGLTGALTAAAGRSAGEVVDQLVKAVHDHSGGFLRDDVAVLAIRRPSATEVD